MLDFSRILHYHIANTTQGMIYMAVRSVQFDQTSSMGNRHTEFEACYQFSEKRDNPWGVHCHDFYELYIHIQGGQLFSLDNHVYEMQPNQLYIIPPFSMHGFDIKQELINYERAFLYISTDTLHRAACSQIDLDQLFQAKAFSGQFQFAMTPEDTQQCKDLIIQLKQNQQIDGSIARFKDFSFLLQILNIIYKTIEQSNSIEAHNVCNNILHEIWIYINEHYMEPINVTMLAKRFGVSVSYLAHEFKKYTNRSVYDYILYRRVMLAKKLIPTCLSLNSVAEQSGFESYSNFSRVFNKVVGLSPNAYKKMLREKMK